MTSTPPGNPNLPPALETLSRTRPEGGGREAATLGRATDICAAPAEFPGVRAGRRRLLASMTWTSPVAASAAPRSTSELIGLSVRDQWLSREEWSRNYSPRRDLEAVVSSWAPPSMRARRTNPSTGRSLDIGRGALARTSRGRSSPGCRRQTRPHCPDTLSDITQRKLSWNRGCTTPPSRSTSRRPRRAWPRSTSTSAAMNSHVCSANFHALLGIPAHDSAR